MAGVDGAGRVSAMTRHHVRTRHGAALLAGIVISVLPAMRPLAIAAASETVPIQAAPITTLGLGSAWAQAVPIAIRWTAPTPGANPIVALELVIEQDGVPDLTRRLAPTSRALTRHVPSGHVYRFGMRAIDTAGVSSEIAWSAAVRVETIDDRHSAITYSSGWHRSTNAGNIGGGVHWTVALEARAALTFTGRAFALIAPTSAVRGAFDLWLDGRLIGRANLGLARTAQAQIVYRRDVRPGSHTLVLIAIGPPDRRVDLDAILTLR